jgi:hypothetical protein
MPVVTLAKFLLLPWIICASVLELATGTRTQTQTWTLDDFDDGDLEAASGLSWIVIADDLAGGATEARLDLRNAGSGSSGHALRLTGRLGGSVTAFAGAWAPLERTGRNLDLSAFDGVRLRAKGPATLDVGLRVGFANFMKRVEVRADWTAVEIPFADLAPAGKTPQGARWDATAAQVFGVTTPQAPAPGDPTTGDVAFEIDDVAFYGRGSRRLAPVPAGPPTGLDLAPFTKLTAIPASGWIELAGDPERDGKLPGLPDAVRLDVIPRDADNMLWARVALRERPHGRWMGVNLAFDTDGDSTNGFQWWGANGAFKFDRLLTAWCFHVPGGCQGYIGLADAARVASGVMVESSAGVRVAIDPDRRYFIVGVPRDVLHPTAKEIRLVAAVGSALLFADDVPGQGAATIR